MLREAGSSGEVRGRTTSLGLHTSSIIEVPDQNDLKCQVPDEPASHMVSLSFSRERSARGRSRPSSSPSLSIVVAMPHCALVLFIGARVAAGRPRNGLARTCGEPEAEAGSMLPVPDQPSLRNLELLSCGSFVVPPVMMFTQLHRVDCSDLVQHDMQEDDEVACLSSKVGTLNTVLAA